MQSHRLKRLLVMLIAVLGIFAWFGQVSASATAGCETHHCYSVQTINHGQWTGVWGYWNRNGDNPNAGPSPADPGAHINSEFWFTLSNGNYVEEGLRNGLESNDGGCNCTAYSIFWADHSISGGRDTEYRHIIANVSPTGATDTYQISRAPKVNQWYVYLNGNVVGTSTVTGAWTGPHEDIGGEFQNTSASYGRADNFDMRTRVINGSGQAVDWDHRDSVTITGCAGFEGVSFAGSPTEWSWQKHAPSC